jgi:hypothetical protein
VGRIFAAADRRIWLYLLRQCYKPNEAQAISGWACG